MNDRGRKKPIDCSPIRVHLPFRGQGIILRAWSIPRGFVTWDSRRPRMKRFAKGHRYPGTDSDKWTIRAYPLEWPRLCPLISNSSPFFFLFFSFFVIFPWTSFFDPVTRPVIYYRVKTASMKASDNYARGEERRGRERVCRGSVDRVSRIGGFIRVERHVRRIW